MLTQWDFREMLMLPVSRGRFPYRSAYFCFRSLPRTARRLLCQDQPSADLTTETKAKKRGRGARVAKAVRHFRVGATVRAPGEVRRCRGFRARREAFTHLIKGCSRRCIILPFA